MISGVDHHSSPDDETRTLCFGVIDPSERYPIRQFVSSGRQSVSSGSVLPEVVQVSQDVHRSGALRVSVKDGKQDSVLPRLSAAIATSFMQDLASERLNLMDVRNV